MAKLYFESAKLYLLNSFVKKKKKIIRNKNKFNHVL